jgi:hypothetical protein
MQGMSFSILYDDLTLSHLLFKIAYMDFGWTMLLANPVYYG